MSGKVAESLARFAFGGVATMLTGIVSLRAGPVVGGLFLAFPAILPASLTLVKKHEGRKTASDDAAGSRYGSVGMVAFGAVVWLVPQTVHVATTLVLASAAWFLVASMTWLAARSHRALKG